MNSTFMDPEQYTGKEWTQLIKEMNPKQLRNSLKRAYRAEAKQALVIARRYLHSSGLDVHGNRTDWEKGIRSHIYSRGGGFLLTVKARGASRKGTGEKSMHVNRRGIKKPVLMWAEEGTKLRKTRTKTRFFVRMRKGHVTGRIKAYGFMEKAAPDMFRTVEEGLSKELDTAVEKVAKKCGFI